MQTPLVLAIHSLPAYGSAGLKCVLQVLGAQTLAVPSLLLTGLGNIPNHQRFNYAFEANLRGTLEHVATYDQRVVVLVGYLANAAQIALIEGVLTDYQSYITAVVVDPICGDNGKAYVPPDLIANWPRLLHKADWATPNSTEVKLLSHQAKLTDALQDLRSSYPSLNWIITSYPSEQGIGNRLLTNTLDEVVQTDRIPRAISGAGDLFTAYFIQYHFIQAYQPLPALRGSAEAVYRALTAKATKLY